MDRTRIIVPVDFTPASDQALHFAKLIAKKTGLSLMLVHVVSATSPSLDKVRAGKKLEELAGTVTHESGVPAFFLCTDGTIFTDLPVLANRQENQMMVIGTHGLQGTRQKLMGADVLKIARRTGIPVLVVQEGSNPARKLNPIVMPVGSHPNFKNITEATAVMAGWFGSSVHIYSVLNPAEGYSQGTLDNIREAETYFEQHQTAFQRVEEAPVQFSAGYATQTASYAHKVNAGVISIMSVTSEEHYYFAQPDKEVLINNEFGIPILCTSDLVTC